MIAILVILFTLPVSVASAERSFKALNRLKTRGVSPQLRVAVLATDV